ncbi:chloramphenicol resistance leader peptide, partial [Pseudomonas aeruginosa]
MSGVPGALAVVTRRT